MTMNEMDKVTGGRMGTPFTLASINNGKTAKEEAEQTYLLPLPIPRPGPYHAKNQGGYTNVQ